MSRFLPALAVISLLAPAAHAREQADFREKAKNAVERTDKDFENIVHPEKLDAEQRAHFDAALKDLHELREAIAAGKWEGGKERLERAIDNIDFLMKKAPMDDGDRQMLGIDLYTLRDIRDGWKP